MSFFPDPPATPTLKIKAVLEEFRVIIASQVAQLFDIQVQGVKGDVSQAPEKTLINLTLSDLRVFDPYEGARYRKVINRFPRMNLNCSRRLFLNKVMIKIYFELIFRSSTIPKVIPNRWIPLIVM